MFMVLLNIGNENIFGQNYFLCLIIFLVHGVLVEILTSLDGLAHESSLLGRQT